MTNQQPSHVVAAWWREDEKMWAAFANACREFRSWEARLAALQAINKVRAEAGEPEVGRAPDWREGTEVAPDFHENRLVEIANVVGDADNPSDGTILARVVTRRKAARNRLIVDPTTQIDGSDVKSAHGTWCRLADALDPAATRQTVSALEQAGTEL